MPKARLAPSTGGCFAANCCRSAIACAAWPCCNFCVSFAVAGSPGDAEGTTLCPKLMQPGNSKRARCKRVRITHLKDTLRCPVLGFAERRFGTEGSRDYFFFALSLLLPRFIPFLSRETIHRRPGLLITLRRRVCRCRTS